MNRLLEDLRIVEFSAFVAAPLGGMTMAQLGAEVIRVDPIGGAIDFARWPVTDSGASLYWAGLNKAKRSVALALDKPEGRELARAIATAPGPGGGIVLTNLPPLPGLDYLSLKARRDDVILLRLIGNRDGSAAVDYTVNAASGFPLVTGNSGPRALGSRFVRTFSGAVAMCRCFEYVTMIVKEKITAIWATRKKVSTPWL